MKCASAGASIEVWSAAPSAFDADLAGLDAMLSDEERARARRFHFRRDADRYVVARGNLRVLLGQYCKTDPAGIRFAYGPHGRPRMLAESPSQQVHFNLSHSDDLVLYAFSRDCMEIGIDVERERVMPDLEQLAELVFTAREHDELARAGASARQAAFFKCWTRKEAMAKATGEGLTAPLDRFDVSLTPGAPARLASFAGDALETARWTLLSFEPAPGFHAALAARASGVDLQCLALSALHARGGTSWQAIRQRP